MDGNGRSFRQFEGFRLDLEKKVLWRDGELVHLPPKAVEMLCVLIENRGEIVTKDELLSQIWHDSFVEESVLAQNIHHLRKTFKNLNLIQTVPRRGYRFAGEVHDAELIVEHEIVERALLAEISEDSLKDLGFRGDVGKISRTKHRLLFASALILIFALAVGLAMWQANQPSAKPEIKSIAVLPLKNLNDEQNDAFSLGLTDSLISRLGALNRFAVRPFSAVEKFGQSGKDAVGFGVDLKTDAVLEGTIQQTENRLRVNLRLIDVRNGRQIWTESFDETASDVLRLQDAISGKVARFLLDKIRPEEELLLSKRPTENTEAFRFYLAGRTRWMRRDGRADCLTFYQKALEIDPNFALAYLGIADLYAFTYETKIAEDALNKAIELDPNLAEAFATRGFLQMFHHWDWQAAEISLRRAVELAPNSSKARHWLGVYLSIRGRLDEAKREMEKALELDPTALVVMTDIAEIDYFRRDYERAENALNRVLEIDRNFINARIHLVKIRYKRGASYFLEDAEFNVFHQKLLKSEGLAPNFDTTELEQILARRDEKNWRENHLKSVLAAVKNKPEGYLALTRFYAISGETQNALDALEKASNAKPFVMPFVAVDPLFDSLRDEPRFQAVLRKMNL